MSAKSAIAKVETTTTRIKLINGKDVKAPSPSALPNIWGSKTWAKRTNEPIEAYSVFSFYLHDKELHASAWVAALDKEALTEFPPSLKTKEALSSLAKDWKWEIRKNDFINQIYAFARASEQKEIEKTGELFGQLGHELIAWGLESVQKKRTRGDELQSNEIVAILKLGAEIKMQSDDLAERRKHRLSVRNTPTNKIKQLLRAMEKIDD